MAKNKSGFEEAAAWLNFLDIEATRAPNDEWVEINGINWRNARGYPLLESVGLHKQLIEAARSMGFTEIRLTMKLTEVSDKPAEDSTNGFAPKGAQAPAPAAEPAQAAAQSLPADVTPEMMVMLQQMMSQQQQAKAAESDAEDDDIPF